MENGIKKSCLNCDFEEDCRKIKSENEEERKAAASMSCDDWKPDIDTLKKMNEMQDKRIHQFDLLMGKYIPDEFREWLIRNGFFQKPPSIHHHGAYTGALFDHSFAVTNILVDLTEQMGLNWQQDRSPYIVGMFHDLCKIDTYQRTNDEKWEYNNATLLPGHGEKSVILLQQHIKLTDEEMLCIRWHMGAFDDKENWNSYGRSVTKYQNVLWTHHADMYAARVLQV